MRRVRCYDCGKRYDYDIDGFCPRCGAFTMPEPKARIGTDGAVVRAAGINECNRKNFFLHAEGENQKRRSTLLEGIEKRSRTAGVGSIRKVGGRVLGGKTNSRGLLDAMGDILGEWINS